MSNKSVPRDAITVRAAEETDRAALESFACSSGLQCEEEVEAFIRTEAMDTFISEVADYRMLLAFEGEALAGAIAHRIDILTLSNGDMLNARLIHVIAVGADHRGTTFEDGTRLSDTLLATVVAEVKEFSKSDIFTVIVANENDRSLTMLERCGSWSQTAYDHLHVRLTGRFTI